MSDVLVTWSNATGGGSWSIANGGIALGNALESAVMVSLFSDRVAPVVPSAADASVGIGPPGQSSSGRRGWWADAYAERPIGSRLWQLARAIKANASEALTEVEDVCNEALQWLLDDGVAASVTVAARWIAPTLIGIDVTVLEPSATSPTPFSFEWAWESV